MDVTNKAAAEAAKKIESLRAAEARQWNARGAHAADSRRLGMACGICASKTFCLVAQDTAAKAAAEQAALASAMAKADAETRELKDTYDSQVR